MTQPTLLIVDDDPIVLAALREALQTSYRLAFASDGATAITAAQRLKPALILLDIQMPDQDGLAVCRQIKDDPDLAPIPIIFVTSLSDRGDEVHGLEAGAVDYITKPISPAILQARVRTHLRLAQAQKDYAEVEKIKVYRAMVFSTQHVLNNYLNQVGLFRMTAESLEDFPQDILELFDECTHQAERLVMKLSELEQIDEETIRESVMPGFKA